ncbi:MAG TPA: methyltransferase domain-containing protein, partial [Pseudonocardia sp.]|nr:methyltransferase domain-containing protein [Pseudonocardia sp.]
MGDSVADYDAIYAGLAVAPGSDGVPWNIGEPQPAIAALIDVGRVRGEVLDAGCGVGETALYLAARGYVVVGLDLSPTAIGQARHA